MHNFRSCYINNLLLRLDLRTGGTAVRRMLAFAAVGLAALLGGCIQDGLMDMARFQLKPDDIIIERRPSAEYEKLFPYYVELCAASQFRSKLTGEGVVPPATRSSTSRVLAKTKIPHFRNCGGAAGSQRA